MPEPLYSAHLALPEFSAPPLAAHLSPRTWRSIHQQVQGPELPSPPQPVLFHWTPSNSPPYRARLCSSWKDSPGFPEIGARSCRESTGTRLTQSSPPQTTSGNSTHLARGSHLQGFVEARAARRDLGGRLLHTEGETEARRGGRPALGTARRRQSSCPVVLPGCPCLPVWDTRGPGRVRRLVSGCFLDDDFTSEHQHQGIPVHPLLIPNL